VYQQGPPAYRGLTTLPGTVAVTCHTSPDVTCPYCANADLVFLMGKVSFSATISDDDLFDGVPQPLVAVVCSKSHLFFLREKDILTKTDARVV
jgi:hypothetical protein